jgi:ubiquinone/menaquinone biosynthesis C-methylase UbiE
LYPSSPEVIKCDLNKRKIPFSDNTFDEVYSRFVFEHINNPNKFLKDCIRVLKKKGRLILMTDNAGFWGFHSGRYTKTLSIIHYGGYNREDTDLHFAIYTPEHIKNHLKVAGFKIRKIRYMTYREVLKRQRWKNIVNDIMELFLKSIGLTNVAMYGIYAEAIK